MKRYRVIENFTSCISFEIEAEDEEQAQEMFDAEVERLGSQEYNDLIAYGAGDSTYEIEDITDD